MHKLRHTFGFFLVMNRVNDHNAEESGVVTDMLLEPVALYWLVGNNNDNLHA